MNRKDVEQIGATEMTEEKMIEAFTKVCHALEVGTIDANEGIELLTAALRSVRDNQKHKDYIQRKCEEDGEFKSAYMVERLAYAIESVTEGCSKNYTMIDPQKAALAVLQIISKLQGEPVAMRYGWDGDGWQYIDNGSGSDWQKRHEDAEPLYTHPPLVRENAWQPIDSAPKDGSWMLVYQEGVLEPSISVCCFEDGWWYCHDGKNCELPLRGIEPTHWMPLPTPPKENV